MKEKGVQVELNQSQILRNLDTEIPENSKFFPPGVEISTRKSIICQPEYTVVHPEIEQMGRSVGRQADVVVYVTAKIMERAYHLSDSPPLKKRSSVICRGDRV